MTQSQTRFVNILLQPESKVGFSGIVSATNYYLSVNDDERAEISSMITELVSSRITTVLDLLMYMIIGSRDRRLLPALRFIASEDNASARDVALHVLSREIDGWPETTPRQSWMGPPLQFYDKAVDLQAEMQRLLSASR